MRILTENKFNNAENDIEALRLLPDEMLKRLLFALITQLGTTIIAMSTNKKDAKNGIKIVNKLLPELVDKHYNTTQ